MLIVIFFVNFIKQMYLTTRLYNTFYSRVYILLQDFEAILYQHTVLLTSDRNREATACNACLGQAVNQSMDELLTKPGKFLHLFFSVSPTGDIAITMWRLLAHLLTKYPQVLSLVGGNPAF